MSFWADHFGERVGARAEQLHPAVAHDVARWHERGAQILHRLPGVVADSGDDLDGVAQQFLVHARVFADLGDHRGRLVAQVAGCGVDESELPFDADGRPGRPGEIVSACYPVPITPHATRFPASPVASVVWSGGGVPLVCW